MTRLTFRWSRVFALYFAVAGLFFLFGIIAPLSARGPFLVAGVCLVGAFVPLVMLIYFLRGFLGTRP